MNGRVGQGGQPAIQVAITQPTPDEVAICKSCGGAYWLETKIIAIKPSMVIGAGQTRMEKQGIIICGCCLAPSILPWLTSGEAMELKRQKEATNASSVDSGSSGVDSGQSEKSQ